MTLTLGTLPNEKQASNEQSQRDQREVPDSDMPNLGFTLAPGGRCPQPAATASELPPLMPAELRQSTASRSATSSWKSAANQWRRRAEVRKTLADARSEGKHTVLFRVKSNEGQEFVAIAPWQCLSFARRDKRWWLVEPASVSRKDRALSERGIRRHPSPPLAGVPWGRIARSVPAITNSDRHPSPPPEWSG